MAMNGFSYIFLPALAISLAVAGATVVHDLAAPSGGRLALSSRPSTLPASRTFNEVAQRAMPSVVSVNSIKAVDAESMPPGLGMPFGSPAPRHPYLMGVGSGIVIRADGLILTNNHVVENASRITVVIDEKTKLLARVIGTDDKTDLAVIQIDLKPGQKPLPVLGFGNSDQMSVGDWVVAIGSPFGLSQTVTSGIVSAKGRGRMGILDIEDFLQTDAAINPGNSGGPLLNLKGELIGINTAIFSQNGGYTGVGFAIPAKIASAVATELVETGRVRRGWIGVAAQDIDPALGKYFKSPDGQGALVSQISPKGPAAGSDLRPGDLVLAYDHRKIADAAQFKSEVGKSRAGTQVELDVIRAGVARKVALPIGEQPRPRAQLAGILAPAGANPPAGKSIGLTVEEIPVEIRELLGLPAHSGAIVTEVDAGGAAFDAGLMPGDIIQSVNQVKVDGPQAFRERASAARSSDEPVVLYIQRGKEEKIFVPLALAAPAGT
jgi:serine protease Do